MRSVAAWSVELWRAAILMSGLFLLGLIFGAPLYGLGAGLIIYLGWHLYQLSRLVRWLENKKTDTVPEAGGIWGEVFQQFYRLQRSNREKKRHLGSIVKQFRQSTQAMPSATVV